MKKLQYRSTTMTVAESDNNAFRVVDDRPHSLERQLAKGSAVPLSAPSMHGGHITFTPVLATNEQQVLVNYMNARPDKLGTSYNVGGNTRFGPHNYIEVVSAYAIKYEETHPVYQKFVQRRAQLRDADCDFETKNELTIFEGFISKATKAMHSYIQHEMEPFGHTNINEQLLVHGTHIARSMRIIDNGFHMTREDTMNPETTNKTNSLSEFTVGNYFTDELSKADAFTKPFYDDHGNKIYACLICRVLLGCPVITNAQQFKLGEDIFGNTHLQNFYEKLGSDLTGETQKYTRPTEETVRVKNSLVILGGEGDTDGIDEFVTWNDDQQLPFAIVFYKRMISPERSGGGEGGIRGRH